MPCVGSPANGEKPGHSPADIVEQSDLAEADRTFLVPGPQGRLRLLVREPVAQDPGFPSWDLGRVSKASKPSLAAQNPHGPDLNHLLARRISRPWSPTDRPARHGCGDTCGLPLQARRWSLRPSRPRIAGGFLRPTTLPAIVTSHCQLGAVDLASFQGLTGAVVSQTPGGS